MKKYHYRKNKGFSKGRYFNEHYCTDKYGNYQNVVKWIMCNYNDYICLLTCKNNLLNGIKIDF